MGRILIKGSSDGIFDAIAIASAFRRYENHSTADTQKHTWVRVCVCGRDVYGCQGKYRSVAESPSEVFLAPAMASKNHAAAKYSRQ